MAKHISLADFHGTDLSTPLNRIYGEHFQKSIISSIPDESIQEDASRLLNRINKSVQSNALTKNEGEKAAQQLDSLLEKARQGKDFQRIGEVGSFEYHFSQDDFLEKGKKAQIGEIREWKGKKHQKQADGSWKPVKAGGKKGSKKETESNAKPKTPIDDTAFKQSSRYADMSFQEKSKFLDNLSDQQLEEIIAGEDSELKEDALRRKAERVGQKAAEREREKLFGDSKDIGELDVSSPAELKRKLDELLGTGSKAVEVRTTKDGENKLPFGLAGNKGIVDALFKYEKGGREVSKEDSSDIYVYATSLDWGGGRAGAEEREKIMFKMTDPLTIRDEDLGVRVGDDIKIPEGAGSDFDGQEVAVYKIGKNSVQVRNPNDYSLKSFPKSIFTDKQSSKNVDPKEFWELIASSYGTKDEISQKTKEQSSRNVDQLKKEYDKVQSEIDSLYKEYKGRTISEEFETKLRDLQKKSQKILDEHFDSPPKTKKG